MEADPTNADAVARVLIGELVMTIAALQAENRRLQNQLAALIQSSAVPTP